ncbi:hypothetical protein [Nonomuraea insulae]|uniref:Uncharacterized protein n=1 Tax=Nonomuraea insulae TaxID=1616787 RepID=A0ABW1CV06_9ACTN
MTRSLLLVSLAAGSLTVPAPAASAATEPAIRSITVRPVDPVVGAEGSVRLVIDVIAKGARGKDGVTVKVEPGAPPVQQPAQQPVQQPVQHPVRPPAHPQWAPPVAQPAEPPAQAPVRPPAKPPAQAPAKPPAEPAAQAPGQAAARPPVQGQAPAEPLVKPPAQPPVLAPGQTPAEAPAEAPALTAAQAAAPEPDVAPATVPSRATGAAPSAPAPVGEVVSPLNPQEDASNPRQVPAAADATAPKVSVPEALPPRLVWRQAPDPAFRMTDGWQTWRFLPDKRLNRFYPAGTWTITATAKGLNGTTVTQYASFELKRETKFSEVRAEKSARADGVRVRGSLTRVDPRGLTDFGPFAKQRLEILWRRDESSAWERVGETRTDAAGGFVSTIGGHLDGQWRVRYPGTGHYAPEVSKSQQITQ